MKSFLIVFIVIPGFIQAQNHEDGPEGNVLEDVVTLDENNSEDGAAYENLMQYLSHPLNLNLASADELKLLQLLTEIQISNLIKHRDENGKLISIHELQTIDGFDAGTIQKLLPYVVIKAPSEIIDKSLPRRMLTQGGNYIMLLTARAIESKRGFQNSENKDQHFVGSPERTVFRYRSYRPGDFSMGLTAEKDEGEQFMWNPHKRQFAFDHLSFHIQLINKGRIKNLLAGDYQCQFGQGLIWGGALGFGKGAETISTTRKGNIGLVPYTSAYEAGFLRGVATSIQLPARLLLNVIYSSTRRDASGEETNGEPIVSSIQTTGLHRNIMELDKRKTLKEQIFGGVLQYKLNTLETGISFQQVSYGATIVRKPQPYNQFAFQGKQNTNGGIFVNYNYDNISFFSELATSIGYGRGYVLGSLISLTKKLDMSVLYRNFSKDYYSFYSNAFSENTKPQNETGIYWGWKYKFNRRFTYAGYFDLFEFPWLKFRTYAPSKGYESLMRLSWQPSKSFLFFIQARHEVKSRNSSEAKTTYLLNNVIKNNYWINFDYTVHPSLKMKTRVQFSDFHNGRARSTGSLIFHDITMTVKQFKCSGRYALFETDDFDNRQYAYENDVWMSYSIPAYYGKGVRKYILLQYKANKKITFWLRYSHTRYVDRLSIGSGPDEINGNKRNDIKFEMRFSF
jgi:hypothetical protein